MHGTPKFPRLEKNIQILDHNVSEECNSLCLGFRYMGISLHIPKFVAPVVWKVVSQENIISIIIIIISCSDHSNQFDLKLMKRSLCLSSWLMDHRTTVVPGWLQWLVSL